MNFRDVFFIVVVGSGLAVFQWLITRLARCKLFGMQIWPCRCRSHFAGLCAHPRSQHHPFHVNVHVEWKLFDGGFFMNIVRVERVSNKFIINPGTIHRLLSYRSSHCPEDPLQMCASKILMSTRRATFYESSQLVRHLEGLSSTVGCCCQALHATTIIKSLMPVSSVKMHDTEPL